MISVTDCYTKQEVHVQVHVDDKKDILKGRYTTGKTTYVCLLSLIYIKQTTCENISLLTDNVIQRGWTCFVLHTSTHFESYITTNVQPNQAFHVKEQYSSFIATSGGNFSSQFRSRLRISNRFQLRFVTAMPPKRRHGPIAVCSTSAKPAASIDPTALTMAITDALKSKALIDVLVPILTEAIADIVSTDIHKAVDRELQ